MGKKVKKGVCKICGISGEVSYEHVPPKSAFNNNKDFYTARVHPLFEKRNATTFEELTKIDKSKVKKEQGGVGFYSLCKICNNNTGGWYGRSYVDWVKQSAKYFDHLRENNHTSDFNVKLFPLRVIKQIVSMFISINYVGFIKDYPALKSFILQKRNNVFDNRIRVFVYYNLEGSLRYEPNLTLYNIQTSNALYLSEITFPPLGYVMVMNEGEVDNRLLEITRFVNFNYDDEIELNQQMNIMPTHLRVVGDYRTKDEIQKSLDSSNEITSEHNDS